MYRRGGLSHPTFLIDDRNNFAHIFLLYIVFIVEDDVSLGNFNIALFKLYALANPMCCSL